MKSIGNMLQAVSGLMGTNEVTRSDADFIRNCMETSKGGTLTAHLSDKQVEIVVTIYKKHFQ